MSDIPQYIIYGNNNIGVGRGGYDGSIPCGNPVMLWEQCTIPQDEWILSRQPNNSQYLQSGQSHSDNTTQHNSPTHRFNYHNFNFIHLGGFNDDVQSLGSLEHLTNRMDLEGGSGPPLNLDNLNIFTTSGNSLEKTTNDESSFQNFRYNIAETKIDENNKDNSVRGVNDVTNWNFNEILARNTIQRTANPINDRNNNKLNEINRNIQENGKKSSVNRLEFRNNKNESKTPTPDKKKVFYAMRGDKCVNMFDMYNDYSYTNQGKQETWEEDGQNGKKDLAILENENTFSSIFDFDPYYKLCENVTPNNDKKESNINNYSVNNNNDDIDNDNNKINILRGNANQETSSEYYRSNVTSVNQSPVSGSNSDITGNINNRVNIISNDDLNKNSYQSFLAGKNNRFMDKKKNYINMSNMSGLADTSRIPNFEDSNVSNELQQKVDTYFPMIDQYGNIQRTVPQGNIINLSQVGVSKQQIIDKKMRNVEYKQMVARQIGIDGNNVYTNQNIINYNDSLSNNPMYLDGYDNMNRRNTHQVIQSNFGTNRNHSFKRATNIIGTNNQERGNITPNRKSNEVDIINENQDNVQKVTSQSSLQNNIDEQKQSNNYVIDAEKQGNINLIQEHSKDKITKRTNSQSSTVLDNKTTNEDPISSISVPPNCSTIIKENSESKNNNSCKNIDNVISGTSQIYKTQCMKQQDLLSNEAVTNTHECKNRSSSENDNSTSSINNEKMNGLQADGFEEKKILQTNENEGKNCNNGIFSPTIPFKASFKHFNNIRLIHLDRSKVCAPPPTELYTWKKYGEKLSSLNFKIVEIQEVKTKNGIETRIINVEDENKTDEKDVPDVGKSENVDIKKECVDESKIISKGQDKKVVQNNISRYNEEKENHNINSDNIDDDKLKEGHVSNNPEDEPENENVTNNSNTESSGKQIRNVNDNNKIIKKEKNEEEKVEEVISSNYEKITEMKYTSYFKCPVLNCPARRRVIYTLTINSQIYPLGTGCDDKEEDGCKQLNGENNYIKDVGNNNNNNNNNIDNKSLGCRNEDIIKTYTKEPKVVVDSDSRLGIHLHRPNISDAIGLYTPIIQDAYIFDKDDVIEEEGFLDDSERDLLKDYVPANSFVNSKQTVVPKSGSGTQRQISKIRKSPFSRKTVVSDYKMLIYKRNLEEIENIRKNLQELFIRLVARCSRHEFSIKVEKNDNICNSGNKETYDCIMNQDITQSKGENVNYRRDQCNMSEFNQKLYKNGLLNGYSSIHMNPSNVNTTTIESNNENTITYQQGISRINDNLANIGYDITGGELSKNSLGYINQLNRSWVVNCFCDGYGDVIDCRRQYQISRAINNDTEMAIIKSYNYLIDDIGNQEKADLLNRNLFDIGKTQIQPMKNGKIISGGVYKGLDSFHQNDKNQVNFGVQQNVRFYERFGDGNIQQSTAHKAKNKSTSEAGNSLEKNNNEEFNLGVKNENSQIPKNEDTDSNQKLKENPKEKSENCISDSAAQKAEMSQIQRMRKLDEPIDILDKKYDLDNLLCFLNKPETEEPEGGDNVDGTLTSGAQEAINGTEPLESSYKNFIPSAKKENQTDKITFGKTGDIKTLIYLVDTFKVHNKTQKGRNNQGDGELRISEEILEVLLDRATVINPNDDGYCWKKYGQKKPRIAKIMRGGTTGLGNNGNTPGSGTGANGNNGMKLRKSPQEGEIPSIYVHLPNDVANTKVVFSHPPYQTTSQTKKGQNSNISANPNNGAEKKPMAKGKYNNGNNNIISSLANAQDNRPAIMIQKINNADIARKTLLSIQEETSKKCYYQCVCRSCNAKKTVEIYVSESDKPGCLDLITVVAYTNYHNHEPANVAYRVGKKSTQLHKGDNSRVLNGVSPPNVINYPLGPRFSSNFAIRQPTDFNTMNIRATNSSPPNILMGPVGMNINHVPPQHNGIIMDTDNCNEQGAMMCFPGANCNHNIANNYVDPSTCQVNQYKEDKTHIGVRRQGSTQSTMNLDEMSERKREPDTEEFSLYKDLDLEINGVSEMMRHEGLDE